MKVSFKKRKQLYDRSQHWSSFASREGRLFSVLRLYKAISVFPTNLAVICGFSVSEVSQEVVGFFLCQELILRYLICLRTLKMKSAVFHWLWFCGCVLFLFLPKTRAYEVVRFSDMPECPLKVSKISGIRNRNFNTHTHVHTKWKCG